MFGTRIVCACLTLLGLMTVGLAQSQTASLDQLSWLSGCWEGRQGEAFIEELWSKPRGLSMLALSRTVKEGKTVSYEFLQIRQDNQSLVYIAQPRGAVAVRFKLLRTSVDETVFENLQHDFPQRIIYQRKGRLLLASIEGTDKGKKEREEFQMRKVRCDLNHEKQ